MNGKPVWQSTTKRHGCVMHHTPATSGATTGGDDDQYGWPLAPQQGQVQARRQATAEEMGVHGCSGHPTHKLAVGLSYALPIWSERNASRLAELPAHY